MVKYAFLTDAQLKSELERCLYCEEKPCQKACPAGCSPADFIMAARKMEKSDFQRSAALIMSSNPFGGVCGAVCPDWHCMAACSRNEFDEPIKIPAVQAAIIQRAKDLKKMPLMGRPKKISRKKVAIVGSGPAGLSAAAVLARMGYAVNVFEQDKRAGGMCNLIPESRLNKKILETDIEFIKRLGNVNIKFGRRIKNPLELRKRHHAVIVAAGILNQIKLDIPNEHRGVKGLAYLTDKNKISVRAKRVAVIGGGAVAADCAISALERGAESVEIFTRKNIGRIQLSQKELNAVLKKNIDINAKTQITSILVERNKIAGIKTVKLDSRGRAIKNSQTVRSDINFVILAIKNLPGFEDAGESGIFFAGDVKNGPTSVVEACASGKNAAVKADAYMRGAEKPRVVEDVKSEYILEGRNMLPVPLETDFFGIKLDSPFLISASPHSDGYEQGVMAFKSGWAGIIMKTAFDNVPIHIPSEYMFAFSDSTYANSDNVSSHTLKRVAQEVTRLRKRFPGKLVAASTGGPVTGRDESDKKVWQNNTRILERAGAMAVEYSLSCPQGGDGTKGDIVSQDPELSAKIVDWVMEVSDPDVPKLFKLSGAVTSIYVICEAIKKVFEKYPHKKAGITLANSFPTMAFRAGKKRNWEEGIVVGMSGEGVAPISNLSLAKVATLNLHISGNGGPMDYKAAAHFLALGAKTVQFCTILMKYGYGIINELKWGLSHLMLDRGIKSVKDLVARALPSPITLFEDLPSDKKIPRLVEQLCRHCGNCARCGYFAIKLNDKKLPEVDASKCVGCSICVQKCFAGALYMDERTSRERKVAPA